MAPFEQSKWKVAAVCSWMETLAIEQNISSVELYLSALAKEGVHYALFPELCISGYINHKDDLHTYREIGEEGITNRLIQLSSQHSVVFSVGMPVSAMGGYAIAQLTFFSGRIIHQHYKTHLSVRERQIFVAGTHLNLLDMHSFKMGMHLCMESHYPELSLFYQQQGASLLSYAFASPRETPNEKSERFKMMLRCRAYDNVCFVLACNATGYTPSRNKYAGVATIISPRGTVLSEYKGMESGYCIAEIDFNDIRKIKDSQMSDFPSYRTTNLTLNFEEGSET